MSLMSRLSLLVVGALVLVVLPQYGYAHGMSEAEKQLIIDGGNLRYLWIGASHMLSGYDHLAFVFGIVFFLTSLKDIIKYVTAFTVGHSITLIAATFAAVQVNVFLIDADIALSVCYIAFANLDGFRKFLDINPPNLLVMIFGLGLIHGLGLSTQLQQLPLSEDQLLMNIVSFNVGIEIGQIGALAVMLLIIAAFRKGQAFAAFSRIANTVLILAGAYLFLFQMHGYEHARQPEDPAVRSESSEEADTPLPESSWKESIKVTIPARGDKEYKLQVAKDARLEYSWTTDGIPLFFDFHGEPTGDTTGYFKSYAKSTDRESEGFLMAPFDGVHGWYWKNDTSSPVTITLKVGGAYQRLDVGTSID